MLVYLIKDNFKKRLELFFNNYLKTKKNEILLISPN